MSEFNELAEIIEKSYYDNVIAHYGGTNVLLPDGSESRPDEKFMLEMETYLGIIPISELSDEVVNDITETYRHYIASSVLIWVGRGKTPNNPKIKFAARSSLCHCAKWQFDPEWKTSTVVLLCKEPTHDILPILADALQDAGCNDECILNHLRFSESHVCSIPNHLKG